MSATNELLQEGSYRVNQSPPGAANLYEVLTRLSIPFSVSEVTAWADHLLETLESLHNRKPAVVHGCIRPQNLMLDGSGKVELLGVNSNRRSNVDRSGEGEADLRYLPLEEIWPGLDPASQKVITNS